MMLRPFEVSEPTKRTEYVIARLRKLPKSLLRAALGPTD
jgi:hypothetical protein